MEDLCVWWVYVCACTLACVYMCVETRGQCWLFSSNNLYVTCFWDKIWTQSLSKMISWQVPSELAGLGCYIQCRVWMEVQERGNETGNPNWCPVCISEKHCHENWARGHLQVWEIFSTLRLSLVMQEDAALWCLASAGLMSAWLLRTKGSYTFPQEGQSRADIVCHWEWEVVRLRQER